MNAKPKWKYVTVSELPPIDLRKGSNVKQLSEHAPRKRTKGKGA